MEHINEQIDEIMAKKLSGASTPEDEAVLNEWMQRDSRNATLFAEQTKQWDEIDHMLRSADFDTAAAWEKVAAQTVNRQVPAKGRVISFRMISAAAAAMLLIGLFIYKLVAPGYSEQLLAEGGNRDVVLPDNTHITLHQGSRLSYNNDFNGKQRKVKLEGEAFFKVQRDETRPFIVDAQAGSVRVLGTSFNVKCSKDLASVVVVEGKVRFASGKDDDNYVILMRGEKARLQQNKMLKELNEDDNFLYWKTGVIQYRNQDLSFIAKQLSEIFEKNIVLAKELTQAQQHQLVTVSFSGQGIEAILSEICLVTQCRWSVSPDKVYTITTR